MLIFCNLVAENIFLIRNRIDHVNHKAGKPFLLPCLLTTSGCGKERPVLAPQIEENLLSDFCSKIVNVLGLRAFEIVKLLYVQLPKTTKSFFVIEIRFILDGWRRPLVQLGGKMDFWWFCRESLSAKLILPFQNMWLLFSCWLFSWVGSSIVWEDFLCSPRLYITIRIFWCQRSCRVS